MELFETFYLDVVACGGFQSCTQNIDDDLKKDPCTEIVSESSQKIEIDWDFLSCYHRVNLLSGFL